jgi:4'-phosphopantetheinyl transferase
MYRIKHICVSPAILKNVVSGFILVNSFAVFPLPDISTLPEEGALHLWSAFILSAQNEEGSPCDRFLGLMLNAEEKERAHRYQVRLAREQFVATRALLRILLSQYLQKDPRKIKFCYSAHGKPELSMPSSRLHFNISHSKGVVLFAVSQGQPVGVDLERIDPATKVAAIARRIFSAQEQAEINRLPPLEQQAKFFQIWTRKEALIKLFGDRLFPGLKTYEVSAEGASGGSWINLGRQSIWLQDLCLMESFAAAIATPALPTQVQHRWWHWSSTGAKSQP